MIYYYVSIYYANQLGLTKRVARRIVYAIELHCYAGNNDIKMFNSNVYHYDRYPTDYNALGVGYMFRFFTSPRLNRDFCISYWLSADVN